VTTPAAEPTTISAIECARAFDLGTPRGELVFAARGQSNPLGVFRLETERGSFAIKKLGAAPRPLALAIEQAAYAAGISLPQPLPSVDNEFALCDRSGRQPIWIRAFPWIDGSPSEWWSGDESSAFDVARIMARVHALPRPDIADDDAAWEPPGEVGWSKFGDSACERGLVWGEALRAKIPALVAIDRLRAAASLEPKVVSQRDYHFPNIITPEYGPRVLIDWDAAGFGVARHEALLFALRWATPSRGTPQRDIVRAFVRGYTQSGGSLAVPTPDELWRATCPNTWWLWFNIVRDLSSEPGPDPDLLPVLISQVGGPDHAVLERTVALFA
jgi:aminoglycoside phosphotransferase (APT) family kinase protein